MFVPAALQTWLDKFFQKSVELNGAQLPDEPILQFLGSGVTVVDNPANGSTDVTISATPTSSTQVVQSSAATLATNTTGTIYLVDTSQSPGGFTIKLPSGLGAPQDGYWWEFVDVPTVASGPLGQSGWYTNPLVINGNGVSLVDPNYVGISGATGATCTLRTPRGRYRFTWSNASNLFLC